MKANDDVPTAVGLSQQNLIDQICDEFENCWKRGETPDIRVYLARTRPDLRSELLIELVRVELEYRTNSGQAPNRAEYVERFPEYRSVLEETVAETNDTVVANNIPRQLGNFTLVEKIGSGTFGHVWKAWDPTLRRHVAVKLPTERSLSSEYVNEFQREAVAAAKLSHPGIVRVISFGTEQDLTYIVYELIDGMTLQKWRAKNAVSPQRAAVICAEIADALEHAHQHGVIHRDLKPGNILIDREGRTHITDFGLAKRLDSTSTEAGAIIGTLAYMSPEQAEGFSKLVNARSDLYSLGVILFELLTAKPLFQGTPREIIRQILHVPPPSVSTHAKEIPHDLRVVCHKAIEKRQSDRYRTAAEFGADLRRFLRGEAVRARPLPAYVRGGRWMRRRWPILLPATIAACLLALVLSNASQPGAADTWKVFITTSPPGAHVRVTPHDPQSGELQWDRQIITWNLTPVTLRLPPARYHVQVVMPRDPERSHEVERTVPPLGMTTPSGVGNSREFVATGKDSLTWPVIKIPDPEIAKGMVYVEGTDSFPVGDPEAGKTVAIAPFYVSPREFTFGDFLKLRPGARGKVPGKPATQQPPENTFAERGDLAEHWAEEWGGRLLTEVEFEYLAFLAAQAEASSTLNSIEDEHFELAGGSRRDEIPTDPPIRGILSGYAEWTSSPPNQSGLWKPIPLSIPSDYRIVRGGTPDTQPGEFERDPRQRTATLMFELHHGLGFRVARSVTTPPRK